MLYNLAKRGEIDPLKIDVVDVADKFLKELEKAKKLDLRISARVLLYAAILIRMKSDIITSEAIGFGEEEELEEDEFQGYQEHEPYYEDEFDLFLSQDFLEDEIVDEADIEDELIQVLVDSGRKRVRRYTTLEDLIKELESAEKVRKRRRRRKAVRAERVEVDPLEVPHEEDLEESIERLRGILETMLKNRDFVRLSEISGMDLISKYISALHLAYRKIFDIYQERIFESEIEIRRRTDEKGD